MKKNTLLLAVVMVVLGLVMAVKPGFWIKAAVILLGVEAVANGLYQLIYTRKLFPDAAFQYSVLIRGMFSIVVGLLAFFLPLKFAAVLWTVMLNVLAVYLLIGSLILLYSVGKLRDSGVDRRQFIMEAVISIAIALLMLFVPLEIARAFVRIIGLGLFVAGTLLGFIYYKNRPLVQEPVQVMDDISGDLTNS